MPLRPSESKTTVSVPTRTTRSGWRMVIFKVPTFCFPLASGQSGLGSRRSQSTPEVRPGLSTGGRRSLLKSQPVIETNICFNVTFDEQVAMGFRDDAGKWTSHFIGGARTMGQGMAGFISAAFDPSFKGIQTHVTCPQLNDTHLVCLAGH